MKYTSTQTPEDKVIKDNDFRGVIMLAHGSGTNVGIKEHYYFHNLMENHVIPIEESRGEELSDEEYDKEAELYAEHLINRVLQEEED